MYHERAPYGVGHCSLAVSHFPEKGGDADGKRAMGASPSLRGVFTRHPMVDDLHIPKRVLTARLRPGGQLP